MPSTMRAAAAGSHGEVRLVSPIILDIAHELVARAHRDAEPNVKKAARRHDTSERSAYRWAEEGPPVVRAFHRFVLRAAFPLRYVAGAVAAAECAEIGSMLTRPLISLYQHVLQDEKRAELADTSGDLGFGCWIERAAACERDATLDLRKAGILRRFAELRLDPREVR